MPKARASAISIMCDDTFYLIGGLCGDGPSGECLKVKFTRKFHIDMCNEDLANKPRTPEPIIDEIERLKIS